MSFQLKPVKGAVKNKKELAEVTLQDKAGLQERGIRVTSPDQELRQNFILKEDKLH